MKIEVFNFQAIGAASLEAEGLTVITGPSDRGKSALLRAVEAGLFNRVGEGFVRQGQTTAQVKLSFNGQGQAHAVEWAKGGGRNQFKVDGVDFSRVGRDAPPILRALGFRDEVIGARTTDDGKREGGEVMRPQVARQFDPIFLLDRPGSFVNETMVKLSRLGVLQRANRACSSDLRAAKATLVHQQEQAVTARRAAERLAPAVALRGRVAALVLMVGLAEQRQAQLAQLRSLLQQRQAVVWLATWQLPDVRLVRTTTARTVKQGLLLATVQSLLGLRRRFAAQVAVLPAVASARPSKAWWKQVERWQRLAPVMVQRARAQEQVVQTGAAVTRCTQEQAAAVKALDAFKKRVKTCPLCDRPFDAQ